MNTLSSHSNSAKLFGARFFGPFCREEKRDFTGQRLHRHQQQQQQRQPRQQILATKQDQAPLVPWFFSYRIRKALLSLRLLLLHWKSCYWFSQAVSRRARRPRQRPWFCRQCVTTVRGGGSCSLSRERDGRTVECWQSVSWNHRVTGLENI